MKLLRPVGVVILFLFIHTAFAQNFLGRFLSVGEMCHLNHSLYFAADDGIHGLELWKSDGTLEGTILVKDINTGFGGSNPVHLTAFGNKVYFSASDDIHGAELWKSDGTAEGTMMVKNLKPDDDSYDNGSMPDNLLVFNNALFFRAADDYNYMDLWKTDGSDSGTEKVYETSFWSIGQFTVVQNALFFINESAQHQIIKTDGTLSGTLSIPINDDYYYTGELTAVGDKLYFITNTTYRQKIKLYVLDPLDNSITLLKEYNAVLYGDNDIDNLTDVNGKLYYSVRTNNNTETLTDVLWKSDGTVQGTDTIRTFMYDEHSYGANMSEFIQYGNELYFRGANAGAYRFFKSDGTFQGTAAVSTVWLDYGNAKFTVSGDKLFFTGVTNWSSGAKLIVSDGTNAGTLPVDALNNGITQPPVKLFDVEGTLYYTAEDGGGLALWNNMPKPEIKVLNKNYSVESGQLITLTATAANPAVNTKIIVKNTGAGGLIISGAQISGGDFYIDGIDRYIAPNGSDTLTLTFFPALAGEQPGQLQIYNNDATETVFVINLKGIASSVNDSSRIWNYNFSLNKNTGTARPGDSLFLSNSIIAENLPPNTLVGSIAIRNETASGFVFSLAAGIGDDDNSSFYLMNNTVYSNKTFDFEMQNTYVIRVKATNDIKTFEGFLVIGINDLNDAGIAGCDQFFYNLSYSLNAVAYVTDNIIIAAGSNGVILKSADAGNTWKQINSGTHADLTQMQFVNQQVGYILSWDYGMLLKTENGGDNWFPIELKNAVYPYISNLFFVSNDLGFVVGGSGKILKTSDGGRNWTITTGGYEDLNAIYFTSATNGFICGRSNTLLKTVNGGTNWSAVNMSAFGYNLSFKDIWFTDAQTGYLLAENGIIIMTTDGGATWVQKQNLGVDFATHIYFVDKNVGYVTGGWLSSILYKTGDAGTTWTGYGSTVSGAILGVSFNKGGTAGCIVGDAAGIGSTSESGRMMFRTQNSGSSWQLLSSLDGNSTFADVKFYDDKTGYVFTESGSAYKTYDNGITWQLLSHYVSNGLRECHFISRDTIVKVGGEFVYITTDGAATWSVIPGLPGNYPYCFVDLKTIFYAENGNLFKSSNGGQTWNKVYSGFSWFMNISFLNKNVGIAVGWDAILTTTDGGNTWVSYDTDISTLFYTICFKDESTIFVGGQSGTLFKSIDGGLSWLRESTSIKTDIRGMEFFDHSNGIALSNNGGGGSSYFHLTSDGGKTWLPESQVWENVLHMCVMPDRVAYFAGARGSFVKFSQGIQPSEAGYISGDGAVCNESQSEYQAVSQQYGSYSWKVTPYQEINFSGTKATVKWTQAGVYQVEATPENGCGTGMARQFTVTVQALPDAVVSGADTVSKNQQNVVYTSTSGSGAQVLWYVEGETSATMLNEQSINVNWGNAPTGKIDLLKTSTATGCRQQASKQIYIMGPHGITDQFLTSDLHVYPNPTTGKLYVKVTNPGLKLTFALYDIGGKQVCPVHPEFDGNYSFDLEAVSSGMYVLKVTGSSESISLKIIKE